MKVWLRIMARFYQRRARRAERLSRQYHRVAEKFFLRIKGGAR